MKVFCFSQADELDLKDLPEDFQLKEREQMSESTSLKSENTITVFANKESLKSTAVIFLSTLFRICVSRQNGGNA